MLMFSLLGSFVTLINIVLAVWILARYNRTVSRGEIALLTALFFIGCIPLIGAIFGIVSTVLVIGLVYEMNQSAIDEWFEKPVIGPKDSNG